MIKRSTATGPARPESGAVIVLSSLMMVAVLTFSALAVDIARRNAELAQAQHAIDAAVITAAQYLADPDHAGDYAGAAARVKEVIRQNLGIEPGAWDTCVDRQPLPVVVDGTSCISFRLVPAGEAPSGQATHNVRVQLPPQRMPTVLAGIIGASEIDLTAVAASRGNECGTGGVECPGMGSTTSSAPQATTTTIDVAAWCRQAGRVVDVVLDADRFSRCRSYVPPFDRVVWTRVICRSPDQNVELPSMSEAGLLRRVKVDAEAVYLEYWSTCEPFARAADRERWIASECARGRYYVFHNKDVWRACKERNPGLEDWGDYWSTTSTSKPSATTTSPPPTLPPVTGPPGSIDISG